MDKSYDFSGWATKNDLVCSDGRTIKKDAFKHNDGNVVPLVWNHLHSDLDNILGHALLENREEGVYAYCTLNHSDRGNAAKERVKNGDLTSLSIYANQLKQDGGNVLHGTIKEVSLVSAGANPGAVIEDVMIHSEMGSYASDDEMVLSSGIEGLRLFHSDDEEKVKEKNEPEEKKETGETEMNEPKVTPKEDTRTVGDIYNSLTEEQKKVVEFMIGAALESANKETNETKEGEDENMKHNIFEGNNDHGDTLSHADISMIFEDAKRLGSLKDSVLMHAEENDALMHAITDINGNSVDYGIANMEYLFPDYKSINNIPEFIKRPDEWVAKVMGGVHHTPFSRVKTVFADITEADARAKGYIKGNRKVEEVFALLKRETNPTTVYKKQKLDRDDVVDITDFDTVAFMRGEMRMMLDEELARAILISDGRSIASADKINEMNIRPIWTDDDLFTVKVNVTVAENSTDEDKGAAFIKGIIKNRKKYRGSGNPVLFTTEDMLTACLLIEDGLGRPLYDDVDKLKTKLRVSDIVTVPVMENQTRLVGNSVRTLGGILVNLSDYNIGTTKGGEITMFDDFDIDYNQMKYLIETRCSGALTKPFSAMAIELSYGEDLMFTVNPEDPTTTVLGKSVGDLQTGVQVGNDVIFGTLKYVTGYTGYSEDPELQEGNFIALKFTATDGATVKVGLDPTEGGGMVTLDEDMNVVIRIANKGAQKLVVEVSKDGAVITKRFDLSGLNCNVE